jgi:saccharopine dehydrogenase (NAD+, L-lysine-forming)
MKVLIVGTGGVGESMAAIAARRDPNKGWLEKMVMADYDLAKAQAVSKVPGREGRREQPRRGRRFGRQARRRHHL